MTRRFLTPQRWWTFCTLLLMVALGVALAPAAQAVPQQRGTGTYRNPLSIQIPGDGQVESCADPSIIRGQAPDTAWYIYCTTDPLNGEDRDPISGDFHFHLIPILRSYDLVNWTYMGDVFTAKPPWVAANAGLWAPELKYFNGQYYLYYTASDTSLPGGGSA